MSTQRYNNAGSYFRGRNMVTPNIIETGFAGQYAYELSSGDAIFSDGQLYGVTLANRFTAERDYDASKGGFDTIDEAREYIKGLQ